MICTARDESGNQTTCTFTVEVVLTSQPFVRSDANADSRYDIADAISTVRFLFLGVGSPPCLDAVDSNDDGDTDLTDAIFLLNYLFQSGSPPAAPFGACGFDATDTDSLGCESYPPCE